jgi:hypothetical protein
MGASGIEGQIGYVEEVTYNTPVTVTRFTEFVSEGIKFEQSRIESKGLGSQRRVNRRWAPGTQKASGPFEIELAPGGLGMLLEHAIGDVITAGAGPYTHTYTPTSRDGKSLTLQVGRPSQDGVVNPFTYSGVKIPSFSLKATIDEYVTGSFETYGAAEESLTATIPLASAVYPADDDPFVFTGASLTVDASTICPTDFDLTYETDMKTDRYFLCPASGAAPSEPTDNGIIKISGTIAGDFDDLTLYNIYKTNSEAALVLTFAIGALSLVITMNVRFDGDNSNVEGPESLSESIPWMATSGTDDATAFTAVLTNNDAVA